MLQPPRPVVSVRWGHRVARVAKGDATGYGRVSTKRWRAGLLTGGPSSCRHRPRSGAHQGLAGGRRVAATQSFRQAAGASLARGSGHCNTGSGAFRGANTSWAG